jgi:hypothetical protein
MRKSLKHPILFSLFLAGGLLLFWVLKGYSYSAKAGMSGIHRGLARATIEVARSNSMPDGQNSVKTVHVWLRERPTHLDRVYAEGAEILSLELSRAQDWISTPDARYPYHLLMKVIVTGGANDLTLLNVPGEGRVNVRRPPTRIWTSLDSEDTLSNKWFLRNVVQLSKSKRVTWDEDFSIATDSTTGAILVPEDAVALVVRYVDEKAAFAVVRQDQRPTP